MSAWRFLCGALSVLLFVALTGCEARPLVRHVKNVSMFRFCARHCPAYLSACCLLQAEHESDFHISPPLPFSALLCLKGSRISEAYQAS